MTALHAACWNGRSEAVELLMRREAKLNIKTATEGLTALQVASERTHLEFVWFLVRQYSELVLLEQ